MTSEAPPIVDLVRLAADNCCYWHYCNITVLTCVLRISTNLIFCCLAKAGAVSFTRCYRRAEIEAYAEHWLGMRESLLCMGSSDTNSDPMVYEAR